MKTVTIEIPEILHEAIANFVANRDGWDENRLATASLALFLLQNASPADQIDKTFQRYASRIYLDTLFGRGQ